MSRRKVTRSARSSIHLHNAQSRPFFSPDRNARTPFFAASPQPLQRAAIPEVGSRDAPLEAEAEAVADAVSEGVGSELTFGTGEDAGSNLPNKGYARGLSVQRSSLPVTDDDEERSQRQATDASGVSTQAAGNATSAIASGGRALTGAEQHGLASAFGHDFADVRVHENVAVAEGIAARAYTIGNHIAFAPGAYTPNSAEGRHLLAHELTHVVQLSGANLPRIQRDPFPLRDLRPTAGEGCTRVYAEHYTDLRGAESSYPGRFRTLETVDCINFPGPSVEAPTLLSHGTVSFHRFAEIELDSGTEVHFLLHGSQPLPEDWRPAGAEPTIAELTWLLEHGSQSIFNLEIRVPFVGHEDEVYWSALKILVCTHHCVWTLPSGLWSRSRPISSI